MSREAIEIDTVDPERQRLEIALDQLDDLETNPFARPSGLAMSLVADGVWLSISWASVAHMLQVGFFGSIIVLTAILVAPVVWGSITMKQRFFAARRRRQELQRAVDALFAADSSGVLPLASPDSEAGDRRASSNKAISI